MRLSYFNFWNFCLTFKCILTILVNDKFDSKNNLTFCLVTLVFLSQYKLQRDLLIGAFKKQIPKFYFLQWYPYRILKCICAYKYFFLCMLNAFSSWEKCSLQKLPVCKKKIGLKWLLWWEQCLREMQLGLEVNWILYKLWLRVCFNDIVCKGHMITVILYWLWFSQ